MKVRRETFLAGLIFLIIGIFVGYSLTFSPFVASFYHRNHLMKNGELCPFHEEFTYNSDEDTTIKESSIEVQREVFINQKDKLISSMIESGDYSCCLENPCVSCIENDKRHGEAATCSCLEDVVNGVHPCGECVGGILGGRGNRFLAKYFAKAIAEEVGENQLESLKEIISDKYGIATEKQI
jgi:hypothetical protein